MKRLLIILGCVVAFASISKGQGSDEAQITDEGWFNLSTNEFATGIIDPRLIPDPPPGAGGPLLGQPAIAEAITPEIQALARALGNDPVRIYNYVHDHIRQTLYFGSKKGAQITLLEKSGNDFDQCALTVALLRASGYTNAGYQFGLQFATLDSPDDHIDVKHWLCLNPTSTNEIDNLTHLFYLLSSRGFPLWDAPFGTGYPVFHRVWVTLPIGTNTYYLDPGFKISEFVTNKVNLVTATGFSSNSNALMNAAAGFDGGYYVTNLNETALQATLTGYTTNLLNYFQSNYPNASVEEMVGDWQIVPSTNTTLESVNRTGFPTLEINKLKMQTWANLPTNMMSSVKITFAGTNYSWWMPQLQGQRISLTFDTNGLAQLWQDDRLLVQHSTSGNLPRTNVILYINHPFGYWDQTNNVLINKTFADQLVTNTYQRINAYYALIYSFDAEWDWLQAREKQLDNYRSRGLSDSSREVITESLNVAGLHWLYQSELMTRMFGHQTKVLPESIHRFGRMAQEGGGGYYVDAYAQVSSFISSTGADTSSFDAEDVTFDLANYFGSAFEHGIIEQMQSSNLVAASTVKMLQIGNANGQAVFLAAKTNFTTGVNVKSKLSNYDSATLNNLTTMINNQNFYVLLPKNGSNFVAGPGSWAGWGYVGRQVTSSNVNFLTAIKGNYNGGYAAFPNVSLNPVYLGQYNLNQPLYLSVSQPLVFGAFFTTADPVDVANGTFQIEHTDLALGQAEPRGLNLSRYYNSSRRLADPSGMAPGWIHNYYMNAVNMSAPQASLGRTTPAQAAAMLVASSSAIALYNGNHPNPKNWLVTALIAKWGVDQVTRSGVSVTLGKDVVQFVKQPDGSFTPPANSTLSLFQTNAAFVLQERHGRTFNFDFGGKLTNIVDQYNQALTIGYDASNRVQTVTDWKGRSLTFNYTGTPSRLTSVSDGTRTIGYSYTNSNLVSFTDAEGKTETYLYDTNHQVTATLDALNQLVVSNIYNSFGQVTTQYTQGDTNKTWQIFWSQWETDSQDPLGGIERFFYDDKKRLTAHQDTLENTSRMFYDGQDHLVMSVSPLNETNQSVFDGNHNLLATIDALGFSNQYFYDGNFNLMRIVDARVNKISFGYNAQGSLTGSTNGAGDWKTFGYSSDGTLATMTDSGGTTSYGYDGFGQLNSITYPSGLGSESFGNNWFGDVTNHSNARGFSTALQYDNRRQLTNSIAPTNIATIIAYDAVGNVFSKTDARGFTATNVWSPTRHLLASILPQGAITTNFYNECDWLVKTTDSLQRSLRYTNDAAGRLISVSDPLQRITRFGYDPNGKKIATTNALQKVSRQSWDARGQLITATDAANHTSTRVYDGAGNQIILTNRNGRKWQFQFDGANRLTNTVTPLNRSTTQSYNDRGLLASAKEPSGETATFNYDAKSRLTNRADAVGTSLYRYDSNNNVTNIAENGKTNSWAYDAYNRVQSYRDADNNVIQYRYDSNGNVTNLIYPGGKTVTYFYDCLNRLTNVTDWSGRKTALTYDLASQLTSITRPNGSQRIIGYDAAGQMTNIIEKFTNNYPIAFFRLNWTNDGTMNWEFAAPLPHAATMPTRTMEYDDDNRLKKVNGTWVTNDLDGNMTFGPLTNGIFTSLNFDPRNRLTTAGGISYGYDPAGNRITVTDGATVAKFVINPSAKLSQVLMRIKAGVTNYYIYGAGLLYEITETATATNTLTYHYDYRGSTVALTDGRGQVTDRIEYSLYGLTTYRTGTNDTPFLFNGRFGVMTDANGLLYMRARYYNPYLCRFINADPSGFGGGLNFYAYANGNPVSYLDPFGLGAVNENGFWSWLGGAALGVGKSILGTIATANSSQEQQWQMAFNFSVAMGLKYGASGYMDQYGESSAYWMMAGEFVGTTPFAEGLYGVDIGTGSQLSSFDSGERTATGGTQMLGWILMGDGAAKAVGPNTGGVRIADGAGYQSQSMGGTVYTGGYDPATGILYLGDSGHSPGMNAAGGTPIPGVTPGVTVVNKGNVVLWANDSPTLSRPAITSAQAAQIQAALEAQFPGKTVTQTTQIH